MITMMKIFDIEAQAMAFAASVNGKITIHYDWDVMSNSMVKEYIVKY